MINMKIFSESYQECASLIRVLGRLHRISDKPFFQWDICIKEMEWKNNSGLDLIFVNRGTLLNLQMMKEIRDRNPQTELVVITDETDSAENYIIPEIRPLFLWRKTQNEEVLMDSVGRIWQYLFQKEEDRTFSHRIFIKEKSSQRIFAYSSIYYFETRNKRILLKTRDGEYEFYDSFIQLEKKLPGEFVRCHRGFIVNVTHVCRIDHGEHVLWLDDHTYVPVSKKYRGQVEELLYG